MPVIKRTEFIKAPIERVFGLISHPENNKDWIPDVIESEKLSDGPNRAGSRFRFVSRPVFGVHLSAEAEIVLLDPPRYLEFCSVKGVQHCGRWELEEADGGTLVRFQIQYKLSGIEAMLARTPAAKLFLSRHVADSVEGLKRHVERHPSVTERPGDRSRSE